jgi:hypothetical protein
MFRLIQHAWMKCDRAGDDVGKECQPRTRTSRVDQESCRLHPFLFCLGLLDALQGFCIFRGVTSEEGALDNKFHK